MLWGIGEGSVFSGRFDHAIDEKGRVSIPARFREVLQRESHDRLYITNFPYQRRALPGAVSAESSGTRSTRISAQAADSIRECRRSRPSSSAVRMRCRSIARDAY